MARAALGIGARDFAKLAEVPQDNVYRLERDEELEPRTVDAISAALEGAGVEIIPENGVTQVFDCRNSLRFQEERSVTRKSKTRIKEDELKKHLIKSNVSMSSIDVIRHLLHSATHIIIRGDNPVAATLIVGTANKCVISYSKSRSIPLIYDHRDIIRDDMLDVFDAIESRVLNFIKHGCQTRDPERIEISNLYRLNIAKMIFLCANATAILGAETRHIQLYSALMFPLLPIDTISSEPHKDQHRIIRDKIGKIGLRDYMNTSKEVFFSDVDILTEIAEDNRFVDEVMSLDAFSAIFP